MKLLVALVLLAGGYYAIQYARNENAKTHAHALAMATELRGEAPGTAGAPRKVSIARSSTQSRGPVSGMQSVGGGGGVNNIPLVQLGTGEPRKFKVTISRGSANRSGAAIAHGAFYDIDPSVTTTPERLGPAERKWTQSGEIAILGINGAIDGQQWTGWLERDSTASYGTLLDGNRTVPSYRVIPEPAVSKPAKTAPSWQGFGRTALDRR